MMHDVLAINAASLSTQISGLPFAGPVAGVRIALIDGQWVAFPKYSDKERSVFRMVIAGRITEDNDVAIAMIEAEATDDAWNLIQSGATAPTEEIVASGIEAAKPFIRVLCEAQAALAEQVEKPPLEFPLFVDYYEDAYEAVKGEFSQVAAEALMIGPKAEREAAIDSVKAQIHQRFDEQFAGREKEIVCRIPQLAKELGTSTRADRWRSY